MCPTEYRFLAEHEVHTHLKEKTFLTLDAKERVTNGLCLGYVRTERKKVIHEFQFQVSLSKYFKIILTLFAQMSFILLYLLQIQIYLENLLPL